MKRIAAELLKFLTLASFWVFLILVDTLANA